MAVWRPSHNRVEVIPNDQGNLTTPSCVAFTDTCRLVGDAANRPYHHDTQMYVYAAVSMKT